MKAKHMKKKQTTHYLPWYVRLLIAYIIARILDLFLIAPMILNYFKPRYYKLQEAVVVADSFATPAFIACIILLYIILTVALKKRKH